MPFRVFLKSANSLLSDRLGEARTKFVGGLNINSRRSAELTPFRPPGRSQNEVRWRSEYQLQDNYTVFYHSRQAIRSQALQPWHPQGVLLLWTERPRRSIVVAPLVGARGGGRGCQDPTQHFGGHPM